jgi:predicted nucleotidyltransferase
MIQNKVNYTYETILYLINKQAHGREIAKELNTSLTRIQSVLNELETANVIDYNIQGKNHIYFIKKNLVSRSYILNAENYKLTKLIKKYPYLEPLFLQIIEKIPDKMILLFGSYAKFSPKEQSDIDVYIDTVDKKTKECIKDLNQKLSTKIGSFDKNDLLIQEIIKNHVIITGGEKYYDKVFGQT